MCQGSLMRIGHATNLDRMFAVRAAGTLLALALTFAPHTAHAECSKVTATGPCSRVKPSHSRSPHHSASDPALAAGGIGLVAVGLASFVFARFTRVPCGEYDREPCPDAQLFFVGSLVIGTSAVIGGSAMMYYGLLDAPTPRNSPATFLPITLRPPRGLSLSFRF